jgi:hypothetical protein
MTSRTPAVRRNNSLRAPAVVLAGVVLIAGVGGTATAAGMIHGKDIKKGTVSSKQIKDATIQAKDLNPAVRAQLDKPVPPPPANPTKAGFTSTANLALTADVETQVAALALPAGRYAMTATVNLFSQAAGIAECALIAGGEQTSAITTIGANGRQNLSMVLVTELAPATSPRLTCITPGTGAASDATISTLAVAP